MILKIKIINVKILEDQGAAYITGKVLEKTNNISTKNISIYGNFVDKTILTLGAKVEVEGELGEYNGIEQIQNAVIRKTTEKGSFEFDKFLIKKVKGIGEKKASIIVKETGNSFDDAINLLENNYDLRRLGLKTEVIESIMEKISSELLENDFFRKLVKLGLNEDVIEKLSPYKLIFYDLESKKINLYEEFLIKNIVDIPLINIDTLVIHYKLIKKLRISHLASWIVQMIKKDFFEDKNIYFNYEDLFIQVNKFIEQNSKIKETYRREDIKKALESEICKNYLLLKEGKVFLKNKYYIYNFVIERIVKKINELPLEESDKLKDFLKDTRLGDQQKEAIITAYRNGISVINGGAGTGKTTLIKYLCDYLARNNFSFELCSYTGKASSVLTEKTGYSASTIHKLFGIFPNKVNETKEKYINTDYLIIDEAGLLGLDIMDVVFFRLNPRAKLVFIGDDNQLPPINTGYIFKNMLRIDNIAKVELSQIYRQAEESNIVANSYAVLNDGLLREDETFKIIESNNIYETLKALLVNENLNQAQILSAVNKSDYCFGTRSVNKYVQSFTTMENILLNSRFNVGDKIINTVNNYEHDIMNGDMGLVKDVYRKGKNLNILIEFNNKEVLLTEKDDKESLELGYAITVHKAQGSEWNKVIIMADSEQAFLINKNWIYTAITRAKKEVVILTDDKQNFLMRIYKSQGKKIRDNFLELFDENVEKHGVGELLEMSDIASLNEKEEDYKADEIVQVHNNNQLSFLKEHENQESLEDDIFFFSLDNDFQF